MIYDFIYKNKTYRVEVSKKRMKNIILRYDEKAEMIKISCPIFTTERKIRKVLNSSGPKLIDKVEKKIKPAYKDGYLYLLGNQIFVGDMTKKEITALYIEKAKEVFLKEFEYYKSLMKVKDKYTLRIRSMKSRYGVNSKRTMTITLQLELIQYSVEIIDSVIIHELAHCYVYNHSKDFYDIVYKYCPMYKELRKKLINHIYK